MHVVRTRLHVTNVCSVTGQIHRDRCRYNDGNRQDPFNTEATRKSVIDPVGRILENTKKTVARALPAGE